MSKCEKQDGRRRMTSAYCEFHICIDDSVKVSGLTTQISSSFEKFPRTKIL
jgi:hypothetical protein